MQPLCLRRISVVRVYVYLNIATTMDPAGQDPRHLAPRNRDTGLQVTVVNTPTLWDLCAIAQVRANGTACFAVML